MFTDLGPHLNERQRRLLAGAEARALGRGGAALVARAAKLSPPTVRKAATEVSQPPIVTLAPQRSRRPGGGRKRAVVLDPGLIEATEALVEPDARGDPESPLRWTSKSTRQLAQSLTQAGHKVSHVRVAEILHSLDYSLQGNVKAKEGDQNADRDAQFRYINGVVKDRLGRGLPVLSVDTKKKELVGKEPGYKNGGRGNGGPRENRSWWGFTTFPIRRSARQSRTESMTLAQTPHGYWWDPMETPPLSRCRHYVDGGRVWGSVCMPRRTAC
jgi:hypothetical protein